MKIKYFSILFLLSALGCKASTSPIKTELLYSNHFFSVPAKATLVAAVGGDNHLLLFRYGIEKGQKYLAFSNITPDESMNFGCQAEVFFAVLFTDESAEHCNATELTAFKKVFVEGHQVGEWAGDKLRIYFSIGKDLSFLFAFDDAGNAIKIESDFLSKTELNEVVSAALSYRQTKF